MRPVSSSRVRLPRGEGPGAWLAAGSVALSLLALLGLLALLAVRGLGIVLFGFALLFFRNGLRDLGLL